MFAAQYDHLPVLKMLMEHGANVLHKAKVSHTQQWYPEPNTAFHS